MINDLTLIKAFSLKANHDKYIEFVNTKAIDYEIKLVLDSFGKYFGSLSVWVGKKSCFYPTKRK